MADQKPPDQPPGDPTNRAESGSEQELDEVLAQASALAADLSEQVGAGDDPHRAVDRPEVPPTDGGSQSDLEAELGELERLIANTGKDLETGADTAAEPSAGNPPAPPAAAEAPAPQTAIPDFMAEFTRPEGLAEDTTGRPGQPSPSSQQSGVGTHPSPQPVVVPKANAVGTTLRAAIATSNMESSSDAVGDDRQSHLPAEQRDESGPGTETSPGPAGAIGTRMWRLGPVAIRASKPVVAALEIIDRPIARLGCGVRRLIGWIAIATIGTSAFVYLYSLV
jgi:hypothetical protein